MSAISLIMKLDLGEKDYEVIDQIKLLMNECDDIEHKKQNNEDNKEENIITENKDENLIYDLMNNSNFQEYLNMIYNRGPDNFEVFSVNKENDIIESMNDIEKMKYKEIFDYVNNTNNKIIINSYLNLFNNHSTNKIILKDSETKNIFQFIGEIYNNIKEANNNESSINEKDDKKNSSYARFSYDGFRNDGCRSFCRRNKYQYRERTRRRGQQNCRCYSSDRCF